MRGLWDSRLLTRQANTLLSEVHPQLLPAPRLFFFLDCIILESELCIRQHIMSKDCVYS